MVHEFWTSRPLLKAYRVSGDFGAYRPLYCQGVTAVEFAKSWGLIKLG